MYFYTIFIFDQHQVSVFETDMSEREFNAAVHAAVTSDPYDPWIDAKETRVDIGENGSNGKLYLSESQARGEGERARKVLRAHMKRSNRAESSKKARKRNQY